MDDFLIANATIVTLDSSDRILLRNAAIAVRGREIVAMGPSEVVCAEHPAQEVIDAEGMVALPGLVNGHLHVFTCLYKGTMCGLGFAKIAGEIMAMFDDLTPEMMLAASRLAAVEMLRSGITLANVGADAVTFDDCRQTAETLGEAGMKAFVQTYVQDIFGPTELNADEQLAELEMLRAEYHGKFDGRIRVAPGPSSEASTSLKTMSRLAALAEREHLIVHMHVLPRWPIGSFLWLVRGRSSIGLLGAAGLLNERLVAVHFLGAGRKDIDALAKAGASVAHCPSVWMNMGVGPRRWLPIKSLLADGVNITLGTDSYSGFIEGSDMFAEMRNCALMSSFLYGPTTLKPMDVLRMATINGARALGLGKETGSLEVGKRADINLIKFDRPPVQPSSDIPAMHVYVASGRDVDTVLIDGQIVVRSGQVVALDEHQVVTRAAEARMELYQRSGWKLGPDGATPPRTALLERYPNKQVKRWGARLAQLRGIWNRREGRR